MSDNITVQGFHSLFNYTMAEILQDVYDIPLVWLFLWLIIFLVFGSLFIMMQSLQTGSKILRKDVENLRKSTTILDDKFQSVEVISKTI